VERFGQHGVVAVDLSKVPGAVIDLTKHNVVTLGSQDARSGNPGSHPCRGDFVPIVMAFGNIY
jgi:hypothetical protein